MLSWYCKELGDGTEANEKRLRIHRVYRDFTEADGLEPGLAVFTYYDLVRHEMMAYFAPAARDLADACGALPCPKPMPRLGLDLLVGHGTCWERYFPGFKEGMGR